MLVPQLHQELVWAGARLLHPEEEFAGLARVRRLEALTQNDLVKVALTHALADFLYIGDVFFRRVIAGNLAVNAVGPLWLCGLGNG